MAKQINGWWFPDHDCGPSTWANCDWGEPVLNAQMFPVIEQAFAGRERGLAVDIGANIGYVTSWLARRWRQTVSFEPTPETFECLTRNCTRDNIVLHNTGISDVQGTLCFAVSAAKPDQNQVVSAADRLKKHWGLIEIPVRSLDSYQLLCDFIKIDVEGHEYQVVQGAQQTIQQCRPAVMLEISYEGKLLDHDISGQHRAALDLILQHRYRVAWQHKHDWFLLPQEWHGSD